MQLFQFKTGEFDGEVLVSSHLIRLWFEMTDLDLNPGHGCVDDFHRHTLVLDYGLVQLSLGLAVMHCALALLAIANGQVLGLLQRIPTLWALEAELAVSDLCKVHGV